MVLIIIFLIVETYIVYFSWERLSEDFPHENSGNPWIFSSSYDVVYIVTCPCCLSHWFKMDGSCAWTLYGSYKRERGNYNLLVTDILTLETDFR